MDTLMEDFKSVALEKCELENRQKNIFHPTLSHFSAYHKSNLWIKFTDFSIQKSSKSLKMSFQTLTEKWKVVVFENVEFEYRHLSLLMHFRPLKGTTAMYETTFIVFKDIYWLPSKNLLNDTLKGKWDR